jgi:hypothetical protein
MKGLAITILAITLFFPIGGKTVSAPAARSLAK